MQLKEEFSLELFKILNPRLFSIFNSKNRDIYVETLFAIRELFNRESLIEKDVLVTKLNAILEKDFITKYDSEDEDNNKTQKDSRYTINLILRKLEDCGWLEQEYSQLSGFKENIVLPPYSVRIIDVLYEITKESEIVFSAHLYSVYANLVNADMNSPEYRYSALTNAQQNFNELTRTLRILAHDLRRRHKLVGILTTSNEILSEHFDDYTKNILEQIYLPLKTQDSIQRFKGSILEILYSWMRSPSTIEGIAKSAYEKNRFSDYKEAESYVVDLIVVIIEYLNEVEKLVDEIDVRHNAYVSAVSEKLKSLIYSNQSAKKKLTSILEVFMSGNELMQQRLINLTGSEINLQRQGYVDSDSLFVRQSATAKEITEPQPIVISDIDESDEVNDLVENRIRSPFASSMVVEYVRELMGDENALDLEKWQLSNTDELIKAIMATIRGFDTNVFYTTEIEDERVVSGRFNVPKTIFIRRRKL